MALYLGVDLGTSSLKATLINEKGAVLKNVSVSYPVYYPQSGYSEQEAEDYYAAFKKAVLQMLTAEEKKNIKGLAVDGQMHGLVALDINNKPLRKVILWNDSRSEEECRYLNNVIGQKALIKETGNIAYPGFTAPKILWMQKHEPDLF